MPPFRALGKNAGLLWVSDAEDVATWQRRSLSLRWAGSWKAQTRTEANHTRCVGAARANKGTQHVGYMSTHNEQPKEGVTKTIPSAKASEGMKNLRISLSREVADQDGENRRTPLTKATEA